MKFQALKNKEKGQGVYFIRFRENSKKGYEVKSFSQIKA